MNIIEVKSKKDYKKFIDFPHDLYENNPYYVPELFIAQRDLLDPNKNPFFLHSKAQLFLVEKDSKIWGRVAAIKNNNHNKFVGTNVGFFGFFDTVNNFEVVKLLMDAVKNWLHQYNFDKIQGPTNFSTNETCGVLLEGFDSSPVIMMPYNLPYYNTLLEQYGYKTEQDLLAYKFEKGTFPEKLIDFSEKVEDRLKRKGITIRNLEIKNFRSEVDKIKNIYNSAWDKNWGFVPATDEEFEHAAKDMKMIINPKFCHIAEKDGQPIGFSLVIPNLNEVFKKIKRGRLFPTGLLKLLYYKKKVTSIRIITLGVIEEYRKLGIEACFYAQVELESRKQNIQTGEASWILENNEMMNKGLIAMQAKPYKKYRLYELPLK